tara:strand:+ start:858 stop:1286 length:429 start_codon:yes stop_codon:yes gene_type:complete
LKKLYILFFIINSLALVSQDWLESYEESLIKSNQENKKIILVFQGSDWCGPCIKLTEEVWSSKYFIDYARKFFILLKADFPRKRKNYLSDEQKEANKILAERFNPNGYFPLIVVIDSTGNVLGKMGYEKKTPEQYIKTLESF